jgi:hypothetical protein
VNVVHAANCPHDTRTVADVCSRDALGSHAIAEHPNGHRISGVIVGCGTQGVILNSPPLVAGFLSYADGWTCVVTVTPASSDIPHPKGP